MQKEHWAWTSQINYNINSCWQLCCRCQSFLNPQCQGNFLCNISAC